MRKISQVSMESSLTLEQELQEQEYMWQRTHSLSNTQKVLDDAIRDLEEYIAEDLAELNSQRRYSSNDSAMGGSEAVVSPLQLDTTHSEPSTLYRKRQIHDSVDSAFSNYSSPTNSSEGVHHTDILSVGSDMAVPCNHIRMSSEASNTSGASPVPPRLDSPDSEALAIGKALSPLSKVEANSLPLLDTTERSTGAGAGGKGHHHHHHTLPLQATKKTAPVPRYSISSQENTHSSSSKKGKNKGYSGKAGVRAVGTYTHQRSPILSPKDHHLSESQLDASDHTPTESSSNITASPSGLSLDSSHLHGTVI